MVFFFVKVVGYFTVYTTIHVLTEKYLVPLLDQKTVQKLDKGDRLDLAEKIPSSVNGLVVGALGLYIVFWKRSFSGDVISPYPAITDVLFGNLVGYTLYDLCVMWRKPKEEPSIWIHHIIGLIGASLMPMFRQGAFFPVLFSITELTVLPGNVVWYLQRLNMKHTALYDYALLLRVAFFIVFRPLMAPFCLYYSLNNPGPLLPHSHTILSHLLQSRAEALPQNALELMTWGEKFRVLRANLSLLPTIVPTLSTMFVCMFGVLNLGWAYVITSHFINRYRKPRKPKFGKDIIEKSRGVKLQ